jgi:type IV pilus assembly protein PilB
MATSDPTAKINKQLGEILLEKGIISKSQLESALKKQGREKEKYLGQILMEIGVPQEKINEILLYSNKRKPIGQILIDLGVITSEELDKVLQKQRDLKEKGIGKPLGMLLVETGYTTYDVYLKALSKHFIMPIASLANFVPCPSLQRSIGEKYAQKNRILVMENNSTVIKLAVPEPTAHILDEIRRVLPPWKKVEFHLASPYEIERCFKKKLDPFSMSRYI